MAKAEDRVLRFAPPPRLQYTVESVSARTQYLDDKRLGTDTTVRSLDCLLEKTTSGWKVTSTVKHCGMRRDANYSDSLFVQLMSGLTTTMEIDSVGGAARVDGFQKLNSRISALKDTSVQRQLQEILSPELMASKELEEWNMWMARLVGRPFKVGSITQRTDDVHLPDDAELLSLELSFLLDTLTYQGRLYGRLMTYMDTDPLRLCKSTNRSPSRLAQIFDMPDSAITILSGPKSDFKMTCELVFDIETLLIASKKVDREIVLLQSNEPGHAVFSSVVETTQETYTYNRR